jgi:hypothetical protein
MGIKVTRFDSLAELNTFLEQYHRWGVADVVVQIVTSQQGASGGSAETYYLTHSDELTSDQRIEAERKEDARRAADAQDRKREEYSGTASEIMDKILKEAAERVDAPIRRDD